MGIKEAVTAFDDVVVAAENIELQLEELNKLGHKLTSTVKRTRLNLRKANKAPLASKSSHMQNASKAIGESTRTMDGLTNTAELITNYIEALRTAMTRTSAALDE